MCQQAERYLQTGKQTMTTCTSKQENFPIIGYKEDSVRTEQRQRKRMLQLQEIMSCAGRMPE